MFYTGNNKQNDASFPKFVLKMPELFSVKVAKSLLSKQNQTTFDSFKGKYLSHLKTDFNKRGIILFVINN